MVVSDSHAFPDGCPYRAGLNTENAEHDRGSAGHDHAGGARWTEEAPPNPAAHHHRAEHVDSAERDHYRNVEPRIAVCACAIDLRHGPMVSSFDDADEFCHALAVHASVVDQ